MSADIRNQITDILTQDLPAEKRADLILDAVATWLTDARMDFRLGLALSEAAPGKFGYGIWEDAELTDAARAVVIEAARALRPTPVIPPAGGDRYAALAAVNGVNTGEAL
ncbi:hypothetical protein ACLMMQ_29995 [Bacillus mobilis]|uniref:hypothetical protein n=1 Tax=Bacillati TaxID=1783272 RepID=UPI00371955D2